MLFIVVLFCEVLLGAALIFSVFCPKKRIWPPPNRNSWQFFLTNGPWLTAFCLTPVIAYYDWNTSFFSSHTRYYIGIPLCIIGYAIFVSARKHLGLMMMLGVKDKFVGTGVFSYSRNPMYVADIVIVIGFSIVANSLLVFLISIVGIFLFLITPFCEEPWLKQQYGQEYEKYLRTTPRFIPSINLIKNAKLH